MSLYRFLRILVKPFIKVMYPTKIINKEFLPDGKTVVLSNHYAMSDIIVIAVSLFKKDFKGLGKQELFQKKLIGAFIRKIGGIPVDREGTDINAIKASVTALNEGKKLFVCPEGTRNKSNDYKKMLPLKNGSAVIAIKTKSPITLMLLNKKPRLFRKNYLILSKSFELSEFYGDRSPDMKERSTEELTKRFQALRNELDHYLSLSRKERKIYENNRR